MKRLWVSGAPIQRRHVLLLATAGITGCGGGSGSGTNFTGLPGTGGTGIYAAGPISGFGSVILKGIKFDDTEALVKLDGATVSSATLGLGMIASVTGTQIAGQPTLARASSIEVWSIAQGRVTQPASAGVFTLAGMSIQTNLSTMFFGLTGSGDLTAGRAVKVWGLQTGNGWTATRIEATTGPVLTATTGEVVQQQGEDGLFVNGLRVLGASLTLGNWVRVQGALSQGGEELQAARADDLQGNVTTAVGSGSLEIEGYVTSTLSNGQFQLGQWRVDVSDMLDPPTRVALGDRMEIAGNYVAGVLRAQVLVLDDDTVSKEVEIEARVESYNSLSDFVLRGQPCDAHNAAIAHGVSLPLRVGAKIKVVGRTEGEFVVVSQLELA